MSAFLEQKRRTSDCLSCGESLDSMTNVCDCCFGIFESLLSPTRLLSGEERELTIRWLARAEIRDGMKEVDTEQQALRRTPRVTLESKRA